jgi:hypothetical protein
MNVGYQNNRLKQMVGGKMDNERMIDFHTMADETWHELVEYIETQILGRVDEGDQPPF